MGTNTQIEWCHHTFNPWRGCSKVSPGCLNCYAERQSWRNPAVLGQWGPDGRRAMAAESYWRLPERWNIAAAQSGDRHRVFCGSMMDVFEDRPELIRPRARLFDVIASTPDLDWLLLTKRPENVERLVAELRQVLLWEDQEHDLDPIMLPNVWLGVTVEDQPRANERIPALLRLPAAVLFLSCEPLLGPLDLSGCMSPLSIEWIGWAENIPTGYEGGSAVDWVIAGCESGPGRRVAPANWFRGLRDQCQAAGVPFFLKQMDADGRLEKIPTLDGGVWREIPQQN